MIYNCNVTKKSHIKTPEQIMPLYSDNVNKIVISPEEKERRFLLMQEILEKYYLKNGRDSGTIS